MEKLQMASNAIGDIESLLASSGIDDDEDGVDSFDEKIRQLVLAALAGKDVQRATRQAEESIVEAKAKMTTAAAIIHAMRSAVLSPRHPARIRARQVMPRRAKFAILGA